MKRILRILLVAAFLFIPQSVHALQENGINLDTERNVAKFLSAAFSDKVWNQELSEEDFAKSLYTFKGGARAGDVLYERTKRQAPWLADHIYWKNGLAKANGLHKWNSRFSVAFGFPDYDGGKREDWQYSANGSGYNENLDYAAYPKIKLAVKTLLPEIEKLSGLPASFLELGSRIDTTHEYARVRILPVPRALSRRAPSLLQDHPYGWYPSFDLHRLWSGNLSDGPHDKLQVIYLPAKSYDLDLVLCFISTAVPNDVLSALVSECVIRSLGLPGKVSDKKSLLGNWQEGKKSSPVTMSAVDAAMIKTLYRKEIESGMDKREAMTTLLVTDESQRAKLLRNGRCHWFDKCD